MGEGDLGTILGGLALIMITASRIARITPNETDDRIVGRALRYVRLACRVLSVDVPEVDDRRVAAPKQMDLGLRGGAAKPSRPEHGRRRRAEDVAEPVDYDR